MTFAAWLATQRQRRNAAGLLAQLIAGDVDAPSGEASKYAWRLYVRTHCPVHDADTPLARAWAGWRAAQRQARGRR